MSEIPENICGACYHPKSESKTCQRADCSELADTVCSHELMRFEVDERCGIVAVIDLNHPEYMELPGLHGDYPWVVDYWMGEKVNRPDIGQYWEVAQEHIDHAYELCAELNAKNGKTGPVVF